MNNKIIGKGKSCFKNGLENKVMKRTRKTKNPDPMAKEIRDVQSEQNIKVMGDISSRRRCSAVKYQRTKLMVN